MSFLGQWLQVDSHLPCCIAVTISMQIPATEGQGISQDITGEGIHSLPLMEHYGILMELQHLEAGLKIQHSQ